MESKPARNGLVDLVKFLASIGIMAGHWYSVWPKVFAGQEIKGVFFRFFGVRLDALVALFFVVAGYYAAKSFASLSEGRQSCGTYISKRVKRLFPAAVFSALVFTVIGFAFRLTTGGWWLGRKWTLSDMILTSFGGFNWIVGTGNHINSPVWFVGALFLDILIFGFVSSSKIRKEGKIACFAAMMLIGLSFLNMELSFPLLADKTCRSYMSFFFGVLFGLFQDRELEKKRGLPWPELLLIVIAAVICFAGGGMIKNGLTGNRILVYSFLVGPALIRIGEWKPLQVLSGKVTRVLGEVSFYIYLFHMPFYVLIGCIFGSAIHYESRLAFGLAALIMIAAAALIYKLSPKLETAFVRFVGKLGISLETERKSL